MKVSSSLVGGSGAYVVHRALANKLGYYDVTALNPLLGVFPPAQFFHRKSADIIHTVPDGGPYLKSKGASLVLTFHNYYLDVENMPFATIFQKVFYRSVMAPVIESALRHTNLTLAVSEYTANLVRSHLGYKGVEIILNGVDEKLFKPVVKERSSNFKLLFVGNPTRRKGADILSEFSESLPDGVILQCTSGLRGEAALDCHRIHYLGSVEHPDMPAVYQQADVLFLPSYREGLCLAVLEAMACGLPVITCNTSSMPELIDHGKGGFLFDPEDLSQAIEFVKTLSETPSLAEDMGAYNRNKIVEGFQLDRMVRDYDEVFRELYRKG